MDTLRFRRDGAMARRRLRVAGDDAALCAETRLSTDPVGGYTARMMRMILIDDCKRLPWRFFAARAGLVAG